MKTARLRLRLSTMEKKQLKLMSKFYKKTMTEYIYEKIFDSSSLPDNIYNLLILRNSYTNEIEIEALDDIIINLSEILINEETELIESVELRVNPVEKEQLKLITKESGMNLTEYVKEKIFYTVSSGNVKDLLILRKNYIFEKRKCEDNTKRQEIIEKINALDDIIISLNNILKN